MIRRGNTVRRGVRGTGSTARRDGPLQTYFAALAPIPLMDADEEHERALELQALKAAWDAAPSAKTEAAYQNARNRFMRANLRLVISLAGRYRNAPLPLADLIQEGNIGLMTAVDRFDPDKGVRFSTYAAWWIRHGVTRALANHARTVRLPCYVSTANTKLNEANRKLSGLLGRPPTIEELAQETQMKESRVELTLGAMRGHAVSLDSTVSVEDPRPLIDRVAQTTTTPGSALDTQTTLAALREALDELSPMEHRIITRRFGLDDEPEETLQDIGDQHKLSRERIRQVQNRALSKMRSRLEKQDLDALL